VTVDEKGIKGAWKEYMEKLMNGENEWNDIVRHATQRRRPAAVW